VRKAVVYPIKSNAEIEIMAIAGRMLREVMDEVCEAAGQGVTLLELDALAESRIKEKKSKPAFKGLYGFPNTLCMSLNDAIVHGIPSNYKLQSGDIISIDCGLKYKGFYSDMAYTVPIGDVGEDVQKLLKVTKESLVKGIEATIVGNRLGDIGSAVEKYVNDHGMHVVEDYGGHGIGKELHEDPRVENIAPLPGMPNGRLRSGMVMAIEPMVAIGTGENYVDPKDDWTVFTKDHSFSAHYEHTVAVTPDGPKILTSIDGS